jgi:class 3 adenylate cyclase
MAELPSGTVTFLFSDVEGSTRLLTRLRGRYAGVLGEHRRLLRAAFDEHDGREIDTEGDGFFVAFARARDAIAAAVSAQRSLASGRWPEGVEVRVRMGVDWVDKVLNRPGADGYAAERVRALCTKSRSLWHLGRGAEQAAVVAALEATARRLGDPVILSQALQERVDREMDAERLDVADALAGEALHWARAAGDEWEIAAASSGKAAATSSITELRERVDAATSLLTDVGNVHRLASLLNGAAYAALCLGSDRDATDFASRAAPIARALPSRFEWMINSGNRGLAALLIGETDAASDAFHEELTLCREMVVLPVASEGLRGLAAVAVVHGDVKRAATLVGAADAHRYDTPEYPVDARLDETFFEPARTRCGSDAWNALAREGSALSFEDAIAYGLEEPRT